MKLSVVSSLTLLLVLGSLLPAQEAWQVGLGRTVITPGEPMPMAGYAARGAQHPEGKLQDLWAKALILQAADGHRGVLVTLDLCGISRDLSQTLCEKIERVADVEREQIILSVSHTHSGPVVGSNLQPMHLLTFGEADRQRVADYSEFLIESVVECVSQASKDLQPARLAHGTGHCTVAVNRRNNPADEVANRRESGQLAGPADYSVPVLAVYRDDSLIACTFGYACHATVLDGLKWSGDYPGFAQQIIEEQHPGCTAMFWAGCGADQNPLPRRKVELAERYGEELASAVDEVLDGVLQSIEPRLATEYREVPLEFDTLPSQEQLQRDAEADNVYYASRARFLLQQIADGDPLDTTYPYPIAHWRLGDALDWVSLGGEVVVDFALAIQSLAEVRRVWVMGYAHDVMAYIPSRRVLAEGGYEGGGAMVYYGLPAPWAPTVEKTILDEVSRQLSHTE